MAVDIWQSHLGFMLPLFLLLPSARQSRLFQMLLLLTLLALSCVSIDNLSLAAYMRSVIGQLSITTILVLAFMTLSRLRLLTRISGAKTLQIVAIYGTLGLSLYPASMGLTQFDPYRLGYDPELLLALAAICAGTLIAMQNHHGAWLFALATMAYLADLQASDNYWDYLLDPFLVLFCWCVMLERGFSALISRLFRGAHIKT
jgi:hypothetical protein